MLDELAMRRQEGHRCRRHCNKPGASRRAGRGNGGCMRMGMSYQVDEIGRGPAEEATYKPVHLATPCAREGVASVYVSFMGTLLLLMGLRKAMSHGIWPRTVTTQYTSDLQCLNSEQTGGSPDAPEVQRANGALDSDGEIRGA